MIKKLINNVVQWLGYEILATGFSKERLRQIGDPQTIIDIGVAEGTAAFYDAFPDAHLVLVEPLPDLYHEALTRIQKRPQPVTLLPVAAGAAAAEAIINIEMNALAKSSLLERTELTKETAGTQQRTIQIERLDRLLQEGVFMGPFGVKIDTEGFELNVIKGLTAVLSQIDFFIVEVSIAKRFEGSYTFAEFIAYMEEIGFEVTDMLSFVRADKVGTRFLDLVFKQKARSG